MDIIKAVNTFAGIKGQGNEPRICWLTVDLNSYKQARGREGERFELILNFKVDIYVPVYLFINNCDVVSLRVFKKYWDD